MDLGSQRSSGNVEDRRGMGMVGGGLGIGGLIIAVIAMFMGVDPTAILNGANEVGGGDPDGYGRAEISVSDGFGQVCWEIKDVRGLDPVTAAHIHFGADARHECPVAGDDAKGDGTLKTGADGTLLIKYLAPGKYGIQIVPPAGSNWHQTATIEGTKTIDAWVKPNEPSFFQEFGPPGHHVFIGFVRYFKNNAVLSGNGTITGTVVNLHIGSSGSSPSPRPRDWLLRLQPDAPVAGHTRTMGPWAPRTARSRRH